MTQTDAHVKIAEYILETERDNYISFCEENDLDPKDIKGKDQFKHVYALALFAVNQSF